MNVGLIVPAAGMGHRLGHKRPKALVSLWGKPLLLHTLDRFRPMGLLSGAVITVPPGAQSDFEALLCDVYPDGVFAIIAGGRERQESVAKALNALDSATDIVVIHDAARPFVDEASVRASIDAAAEHGAASVAIPCSDTILVANRNDMLVDTPDRNRLWACQTPQAFRVEIIKKAHQHARAEGFTGTDDATLVQRMGEAVKLVKGTPLNFKITTPEDVVLAEAIIDKGLV
ncbi:MAG: 2-C-methyl-D-erythritol 4-phosphate cytidylyltransferase [Candidatus Hydrogenedentota bacterium]